MGFDYLSIYDLKLARLTDKRGIFTMKGITFSACVHLFRHNWAVDGLIAQAIATKYNATFMKRPSFQVLLQAKSFFHGG